MKKILVFAFIAVAALLMLSSCADVLSGPTNHFVGRWHSNNVSDSHALTFTSDRVTIRYADGSGSSGSYSYNDSYVTFSWDSGGGGSFQYYFSNSNQDLAIRDSSGWITYWRQ